MRARRKPCPWAYILGSTMRGECWVGRTGTEAGQVGLQLKCECWGARGPAALAAWFLLSVFCDQHW